MPTLRVPLTLTQDWTNTWKKRRKDGWANTREIRGRRTRFHESREETMKREERMEESKRRTLV